MTTNNKPDGSNTPAPGPDATARFLQQTAKALVDARFVKLVLGKPLRAEEDAQLERVTARAVVIKGEPHVSLLWHYQTRDITKNYRYDELLALLRDWLGQRFLQAHLQTHGEELQLAYSRKGRPSLRVGKLAAPVLPTAGHDREKLRHCELDRPFWDDLGLTHALKGVRTLVPAMSRKWKQINHFIEVFDAALKSSRLADSPAVHVADFGSGKGYLTFAIYDWLRAQDKDAHVTGVELRDDMVKLCSAAAARNNMQGLCFEQGDVRSYTPARLDVMIALHACDIATDFAIHLGLRAGASIIMCSPCCHKQLRPQMASPAVLRPLLQHGIHLGQEAEMVTDGLRALLLEAEGYDTQVFEFVSLEHTSKNKMILAVKRAQAPSALQRAELLEQIAGLKHFYGVREQALEVLLGNG
jgi:SAM-dependent methyltransferase